MPAITSDKWCLFNITLDMPTLVIIKIASMIATSFLYRDANATASSDALAAWMLGNELSFSLMKMSLCFIFFGLSGLGL
jgi:hypothetical protein